MPIATSSRILKELKGENYSQNKKIRQLEESQEILDNLWYTDYRQIEEETIYNWNQWYYWKWSLNWYSTTIEKYLNTWIHNDRSLDRYFEKDKFIATNTKYKDWELKHSLEFWWKYSKLKWVYSRYEILSPINILLEDEQWRRIWIDPETGLIINEIPWAWTSWNTEGSGEPEFFLIPQTWTWKIQHKIKTYWTWKGRYDIVMEEIIPLPNSPLTGEGIATDILEQTSKKSKTLIITWQARESFWEDYEIDIDQEKWVDYTNLTRQIPTTLEVKNTKYKIENEKFTMRYSIRWKSEEVEKIRYSLLSFWENTKDPLLDSSSKASEWQIMEEQTQEITWKINLNFPKNWNYKLKLELLDKENNPLTNLESKQEIEIEKIDKQENFIDQVLKSSKNNKQKQSHKTNFPQSFITKEMLGNYRNNQLQTNKSILNLLKQENTLALQLYTTQNQTTLLWHWLTYNYQTQFYYDKKSWEIEIQLPNWKLNKFVQDLNFEYKPELNNKLEAKEELNYIKITDKEENKVYYFRKQTQKLEMIKIINNERIWTIENKILNLYYNDNDWTIKEIETENQRYKFEYEEKESSTNTTWVKLLKRILNQEEQEILNFEYDKIWEIYILKSINEIDIVYNQEWEIINTEEIEDKLKKHIKNLYRQRQIEKFEKDYKLQKKLKKIQAKINTKFTKEQKKRLLKYIKKNKTRYIKKVKIGKKIFYEYIFDRLEEYLSK